jgi:hypothetical protein
MKEMCSGSKNSKLLLEASRHLTPVNSERPLSELRPIILRLRLELMLRTRGYCRCRDANNDASISIFRQKRIAFAPAATVYLFILSSPPLLLLLRPRSARALLVRGGNIGSFEPPSSMDSGTENLYVCCVMSTQHICTLSAKKFRIQICLEEGLLEERGRVWFRFLFVHHCILLVKNVERTPHRCFQL